MKRLSVLLIALTGGIVVALSGCGRSSNQPEIVIEEVWSRPVTISEGATGYNSAAYLKIINNGGAADRLLRAQTDVCTVTEIHRSFIENERMMMAPVAEGLEAPAQGSVELKPGGYHLMLMGMKRSVAEGDSFAVQLDFEKSGSRTVYAKVKRY